MGPAIVVHAGAGAYGAELREHGGEVAEVLRSVLAAAGRRLAEGFDALTVVVGAVETMEDYGRFNAGYGAALCSDGTVELSASVMRGADRAAGAVAGVRTVRNPVRAAELVLAGEQVLMIGEAAESLAAAAGLELWENSAFVTERQRARLRTLAEAAESRGTVGAVCLDGHGRLAAATSTGGINGQPPGRVGDSPLVGAGTWADARVAVSCTGDGEAFIRAGVARRLGGHVESGASVAEAAERVLAEVGELGGAGGLIALGVEGEVSMPFSTQAMPRGVWRAGGEPEVWLS